MNYKNYNDYELIYMVREKDDYSEDILLKKYLPVIKSISSEYYLKYKNYCCEYDDFLQEAIIAFQSAISNYNESKDVLFYSFAIMCVRRRLITFCRNISSESKNVSYNELVDIDNNMVEDYSANINIIIDNKELEEMLSKCILELDIECSCILELKLNGFSYREISQLLDIPPSTVEYRTRKIRKKIINLMNKR